MRIFMSYKKKSAQRTKELVFCAICAALAVVCSFIKFVSLPFGGSITLFSMFFIVTAGYMYGVGAGFLTGVVYSILFFMLEPYMYSPIQFVFDYLLAFGLLGGVAGLFPRASVSRKPRKLSDWHLQIGYTLGVIARYLCHVISGFVFFADYADSMNPLVYTLTYNLTYILPEMILTLILLFIPGVHKLIRRLNTL